MKAFGLLSMVFFTSVATQASPLRLQLLDEVNRSIELGAVIPSPVLGSARDTVEPDETPRDSGVLAPLVQEESLGRYRLVDPPLPVPLERQTLTLSEEGRQRFGFYEGQVQVLEQVVSLACANEKTGETRAHVAGLAYTRASELTERLNRDVKSIFNVLSNPAAAAHRELERRIADARFVYKSRAQDRDIRMLVAGPRGVGALEARIHEAGITEARSTLAQLASYERNGEFPDDLRSFTERREERAMNDLRYLTQVGLKLDTLSQRAGGCYGTARGQASRAPAAAAGAADVSSGQLSAPVSPPGQ